MSEEGENEPPLEPSPERLMMVHWRDTLTVVVENILGTSHNAGLAKIVFGEAAFDPTPGATLPQIRPTITLAVPLIVVGPMIEQLQAFMKTLPSDDAHGE